MATRRERELLKELDQAFERIDQLEAYIASGQELIEPEEGEQTEPDSGDED